MTEGNFTREAIVAEARSWIGTPYKHQASLKGVGCDCLGLIRGVWRALYGDEPEHVPAYAPDWAEAGRRETFAETAARHLIPVAFDQFAPGDVLLFRWRAGLVAKHAAIVTEAAVLSEPAPKVSGAKQPTPFVPAQARTQNNIVARMVHAHDGAAVAEVAIAPWWWRRLAYAFRFPGLESEF